MKLVLVVLVTALFPLPSHDNLPSHNNRKHLRKSRFSGALGTLRVLTTRTVKATALDFSATIACSVTEPPGRPRPGYSDHPSDASRADLCLPYNRVHEGDG